MSSANSPATKNFFSFWWPMTLPQFRDGGPIFYPNTLQGFQDCYPEGPEQRKLPWRSTNPDAGPGSADLGISLVTEAHDGKRPTPDTPYDIGVLSTSVYGHGQMLWWSHHSLRILFNDIRIQIALTPFSSIQNNGNARLFESFHETVTEPSGVDSLQKIIKRLGSSLCRRNPMSTLIPTNGRRRGLNTLKFPRGGRHIVRNLRH